MEVHVSSHKAAGERFAELLEVMAQLRAENGCPWDKEQTHASLIPFLREESHELLDALAEDNPATIREELGDLLHQIVFHCQIGAERGTFTAGDVIGAIKDKMVRRHPHVFSGKPLDGPEALSKQWAHIKSHEKNPDAPDSALGRLPRSMPALARAQTITERASAVGFDWPEIEPVWQKVREEMDELKTACAAGNRRRTGEELGDVLFSLVNLARFLGFQAEDSLSQTTDRFIARFRSIEAKLRRAGKTPAQSSLEEMDRLWDEAKAAERERDKL
jgi:tetrapyrrole methylase family protein/MazG family protein